MITSDLGHHFEDYVARAVASGRYRDAAAVIRDALRLHEEEEHARLTDAQKLEWLRAAVAEGLADADAGRTEQVTAEEVLARVRARRAS